MALTLAQQAALAESPTFVARVRMAMLDHARYRIGTEQQPGNDDRGYVTLAKAILAAPVGYGESFARFVVAMPAVKDSVTAEGDVDHAQVTDEAIAAAVVDAFFAFAR